jgi:tRNA(fMet)-specific endonuclease VapC
MFDTDTVSFYMKNKPENIRVKTTKHNRDKFCISAITLAELLYGLKKNYTRQLDFWLHEILDKFEVIGFDDTSALFYGEIRAALEKSGDPLDNMDNLIAASALKAGAILVSHNVKHFARIKNLKVEDWC